MEKCYYQNHVSFFVYFYFLSLQQHNSLVLKRKVIPYAMCILRAYVCVSKSYVHWMYTCVAHRRQLRKWVTHPISLLKEKMGVKHNTKYHHFYHRPHHHNIFLNTFFFFSFSYKIKCMSVHRCRRCFVFFFALYWFIIIIKSLACILPIKPFMSQNAIYIFSNTIQDKNDDDDDMMIMRYGIEFSYILQ